MAADTIMGPVHPGEILLEEFLKPLSVSQYRLAKEIGVPARRVNEIVHGQRRVSADTALRLARFFGTSERFWINLQARYDIEIERDRLGSALDDIRPLGFVGENRPQLLVRCDRMPVLAKSLFVSFDRTWRPAQAVFVAGRCSAAANTRSGAGGRLWLLGAVGVAGWDGGEVDHGAAVEHDAA